VELVDNPYVSDFTRATLTQFKWALGDPIPVELGEFMIKVKERLPASSRTDVLIDVNLMAEEDIAQINSLLDQARAIENKRQQVAAASKATENMSPSVRAALEQVGGPEIVDDRAQIKDVPPPAQPAPEPVKVVDEETLPVLPDPTVGMPVILPFCPRCGWDMRQKFDVEITEADKENFVTTLLGNLRFKKKYELLGGRMVLTLRALTAAENKMIYQQLLADQQSGKVVTAPEWYTQLIEYRLACSIESVADKDGKLLHAVPELQDMRFDAKTPLDTAIPAMLDYVSANVLSQEVFKRLVGTHLREFQRLIEALEAMALEPSFWTGIG